MNRLTTLALCFALSTVACGGDGGTSADPDTSSQVDDTSTVEDTSTDGDTGAGDDTSVDTAESTDTASTDTGEGPNYPATCTATGFANNHERYLATGDRRGYIALTDDGVPRDQLRIELYQTEEYGGASTVGTYDLDGINYADCGNCIRVRTGCDADGCDKQYYADAGRLVIERWEVGGKFEGHLEDVVLKEVTIGDDFVSTPVEGGGEWCLDQFRFSVDIVAPSGGANLQPTCVTEGTGVFLQDNVGDFTLPNCAGGQVSLHESCGDKAVWLIGGAGWCVPCHAFLEALVADYGGYLTREKIDQRFPGLSTYIVLGEDNHSGKPTQQYCANYAEELGIDPAMILIDHDNAGVEIPYYDPPGGWLAVTSFATTFEHINPYLTESTGGPSLGIPFFMVLRGANMEYVYNDIVDGAGDVDDVLNALLAE